MAKTEIAELKKMLSELSRRVAVVELTEARTQRGKGVRADLKRQEAEKIMTQMSILMRPVESGEYDDYADIFKPLYALCGRLSQRAGAKRVLRTVKRTDI